MKTKRPSMQQLEEWLMEDGGCEATDGCWVEPDGVCPHGCKSWLLELGWVAHSIPPLQAKGSKHGERVVGGTVDWGIIEFWIEDGEEE
jgi:hypothetical protein